MCLRVFVRAAEGALVAMHSPVLSLRRCDADTPATLLEQGWAWELGAHTGCACGFDVDAWSQAEWDLGPDTASAPAEIEIALTAAEREVVEGNRASRCALAALLEDASRAGSVELYVTWDGSEAEPPSRIEEIDAKTIRGSWEPLAEEVVYRFVPASAPA